MQFAERLVYRDNRLVNLDTRLKTAVSDIEARTPQETLPRTLVYAHLLAKYLSCA